MNSLTGSTGGGYSLGAGGRDRCRRHRYVSRLLGLDRLGQLGQDLVQVADDPEVGELEDRRVRVLVDRDDVLRGLHPDLVLDRAGDPGREVQLRRDGLAGLADLRRVRIPAGVDDRARRRDRACCRRTPSRAPRPARSPRPCRARGRRRRGCRRPRCRRRRRAARRAGPSSPWSRTASSSTSTSTTSARAVAVSRDLERVDPADDDPEVAPVAGDRDLRVLEDRALGDELAVLGPHGGDLHRHAGLLARGEAGADLEPEQTAAEQRVAHARRSSITFAITSTTGCARPSGPLARNTFVAP